MLDRRICIAPMMDCTDRHDRYFLRLIAPHVYLYTEMITSHALKYGDVDHLLAYNPFEHPVALQIGGSSPDDLAHAAKLGEAYGYDEINLNVGCPSDRVQSGRFGACLMLEPSLVAECVSAMVKSVSIPVTVKCRIGVDHQDSYEALVHFIQLVHQAGCHVFIIHARKAWLKGLSPKQNREIPPLNYETVRQIKRDFPHLQIILNGGLKTLAAVDQELAQVDGIMIGREAYANPYFLSELEKKYYGLDNPRSRQAVVESLLPYIQEELRKGVRLSSITRHVLGLYQHQPRARTWRRYISQHAHQVGANESVLLNALKTQES